MKTAAIFAFLTLCLSGWSIAGFGADSKSASPSPAASEKASPSPAAKPTPAPTPEKPPEITLEEKKKLIDEWFDRGRKAWKRNKELMKKKKRNLKQECEAIAERAYVAAGDSIDAGMKATKFKKFNPRPAMKFEAPDGKAVTITWMYDVDGSVQKKVQMVEASGNLETINRLYFSGERAPKGAFMVKMAACTFMFTDENPLIYENMSQ